MTKYDQYEDLFITPDISLLSALKKMDELDTKLLLVMKGSTFNGLLSIGDIQRYFIKNQNFEASAKSAMRQHIKVASVQDTFDSVKKMMLEHRTEFMPVVAEDGSLVEVVFWEDVFGIESSVPSAQISLPVVIMAGGKGTRLRPITHIIPKPLVPIGEKPIIQVIMDNFVEDGCNEFYFTVNYKAEMIKSYFDSLDDKTYKISYVHEARPMGTAGSLSLVKDRIKTAFFVSNCDVIVQQDYSQIYAYHKENNNEMTAVAFVKEMIIPYGTFDIGQDGLLASLQEKPQYTFLVNAGIYILENHLLDEIPENEFFHITHLMEKIIQRNGKVGVFPISEGSWLDIGRWQEYQKTLKKMGSEIILKHD
jgi:dTDP-glucose pyrophosphorylase